MRITLERAPAVCAAACAEKSPWSQQLLRTADRWRYVIFACLGAIYLAGFNGQWQIEPDSALYLSLARNLARGLGYTYQGLPHHLVYPGMPFVLAGLFRMFPGHEIAACDALVLLCGLAALALTYRLFCLACDRPTAVIVTLLTGLSHEYFRYCFEIMVEMPFLLGVMAVLAGHEAIFNPRHRARWWDWAIFIGGVLTVVNTKPMMLVLLPACLLAMPWRWKSQDDLATPPTFTRKTAYRRMIAVTAIIAALVLLFFIYDPRHALAASAGDSYEHLALREVVRFPLRWRMILQRNLTDLFDKSASRVIIGIPLGYRALGIIFGLVILAAGAALIRFRLLWGIWIAATIGKLIFIYSHDRYLIPILPLLMFGWWRLIAGLSLKLPRRLYEPLLIVFLASTLIPNLAANLLSDYQQHRRPFLTNFRDGHYLPLVRMADEVAARVRPGDIVLSPQRNSHILSYLSDRTVIEPHSGSFPSSANRIWIIIDTSENDPQFDHWLSRLQIVPHYPPVFSESAQKPRGRSFSLFVADNTHLTQSPRAAETQGR